MLSIRSQPHRVSRAHPSRQTTGLELDFMPRQPTAQNDVKITAMLRQSRPVREIAKQLHVSEPTVYKAIRRLGLTLPSRTEPTIAATKQNEPIPKPQVRTRPSPRTIVSPTIAQGDIAATKAQRPSSRQRNAAAGSPRRDGSQSARTSAPSTARKASPTPSPPSSTPSVSLVRVGTTEELLTVRVDKGFELLKNLSARIVRHERELASARQKYAETLAALALN